MSANTIDLGCQMSIACSAGSSIVVGWDLESMIYPLFWKKHFCSLIHKISK